MSSSPTDDASAEHRPYVPASTVMTELTVRGVVLGALLGIVFAASSVYLALKVGLTVSASIPISVLSITIFRAFGRATILENNIVQTAGSAGESIAAGVAFTLPALLLMGYDLDPWKVMLVALLGGLLGVLMMIPLRHGLIVKEHATLVYPEGTACAEVLIVGEQGGSNARTVFTGFGIGALYKLLASLFRFWNDTPERALRFFPGASVGAEVSPELLGVGYIIGPRVSATMLAGGVLGYLVIMPMIVLFGAHLPTPLYPARELISQMGPDELRKNFVLYIGAGAVATGGIISLARAFPTIVGAFASGFRTLRASRKQGRTDGADVPRTARDMPMSVVIVGVLALVAAIWLAPPLGINFASAVLIVLFGFFFVTVSSRITGEIGSSSNPISGMTVATLLITCLLFLAVGWTGIDHRSMALVTAAIVCVAASNGGTTSQDLKTGYLIGATPRHQQVALLTGVITSALVIGFTLILLNNAYTTVVPETYPGVHVDRISDTVREGPDHQRYRVGYVTGSGRAIPQGRYLVDAQDAVRFVIDPGIGGRYATMRPRIEHVTDETRDAPDGQHYRVGVVATATSDTPAGRYLVDAQQQAHFRIGADDRVEPVEGRHVTKLTAPKAQLFALIIDGILTRKLPWGLVLIGVMIALMMELAGVSSLPFAVGLYLPLATSVPIMAGGAVRYLVDRARRSSAAAGESSPGTLMASGYIAGGAIAGLAVAAMAGAGWDAHVDMGHRMGALGRSDAWATLWFGALALVLYVVAVRRTSAA